MLAVRHNSEECISDLELRWRMATESIVAAQAEFDALNAHNRVDAEALWRATARLLKAQQNQRMLAEELEAIGARPE